MSYLKRFLILFTVLGTIELGLWGLWRLTQNSDLVAAVTATILICAFIAGIGGE